MNDKARWEIEQNWARKGEPPRWEPCSYSPEAYAADYAAEEWAEHEDAEGDYIIIRGSPAHVRVREAGTESAWAEFTVEGESVPSYQAYGVNEEFTDSKEGTCNPK